MPNSSLNTIEIVIGMDGYVPIPADAKRAGLLNRAAVVLSPVAGFPVEIYVELVRRISNWFGEPRLTIFLDNHVFRSLADLSSYYANVDIDDRDAPKSIHLSCEERLALVFETEFWVYTGGPMPYHDSYTISIYSHEPLANLIETCRDLAHDFGWEFGRVISAHTPE